MKAVARWVRRLINRLLWALFLLFRWLGRLVWVLVGPGMTWLGKRVWPVVRPAVLWLSSALYDLTEFLEKLPRSVVWLPYSYFVLGVNAMWVIPLLDLYFTFGLDLKGYFWWSTTWVPLLATCAAIVVGILWFFGMLIANGWRHIGFAAAAGIRLSIILCALPGLAWARLWATLIRFWITKFLLAIAIANGLTAVTLIIVAVTTGQGSNLMLIIPAVVLTIFSLTGGYAWANQYGSGFIGNSGILLGIILLLWGLWVWLFALVVGFVAVAAPFIVPWLLAYLVTPDAKMSMFEPWWVSLLALVVLTGIFAVVPWRITSGRGGVAAVLSEDYYRK